MQAFIQWREDWLLNIADVDSEHRQLVELLNLLAERFGIITPGNGILADRLAAEAKIQAMLGQLGEQVRAHFCHEEALMQQVDFSGYESHRHEHRILLAEYADLMREIRSKGISCLDFKTLSALKIWLIGHIVDADKKFGDYYCQVMRHSMRNRQDPLQRSWIHSASPK
jgi:hemerythrin